MIVDYELLTARVDELALPDEAKQQCRAMAGELGVELVPDRERIMVGAGQLDFSEVFAGCERES